MPLPGCQKDHTSPHSKCILQQSEQVCVCVYAWEGDEWPHHNNASQTIFKAFSV